MKVASTKWLTSICWLAFISLLCYGYFRKDSLPSGFKRGQIYTAMQLDVLDLKYNSWYLAGLGKERIYLGNTTAPLGMLSCSYDLKDTLQERLPVGKKLKTAWNSVRLQVEEPYRHLIDRRAPLEGMHFDLMELLSPESIIVNGYEPAIGQKSIQKVWLKPRPVIDKYQNYVHKVQKGGNFSIDGFITCNRKQNAVLFTYYYRNQFICLDTNMNLRYTGKTIDTNTTAKLNVEELQVDGQKVKTITGSPVIVNKRAYSEGNFIYLQAGLQADNERLKLFENPVTIDVYRLDTGAYCYSLYLPEYRGEALTGFAVRGNMLIALYGRYMVTYSIDKNKLYDKI